MKKQIVCMIAAVMALSTFSGCKNEELVDNETTLNIYALEAGYGTAFLEQYKQLFESKHPGVTVMYKSSTEAYTKIYEDLRLGPDKNGYDLYFAPDMNWQLTVENDHVPGYDVLLEDLTDLYDESLEGENTTIRQKLYQGIEDYSYYKGKQYFIPWAGGPGGFVYNADILKDEDVPKTTNQLMKVLQTMHKDSKGNDVYSLMTSENGHGYWEYLGDTWWAQLEGVKEYKEFYTLGDGSAIVYDNYYQDGYRRNFELIEEIVTTSKMYPNCTAMPHTQAQMYFLEGKAVMAPCGNWLEGEMNENFEGEEMNFKMMKTPIISDLANPDKLNFPGATAEERDAKLAEVVEYIDNGETGARPEGISDFQIQVVRNARNLVYNVGLSHILLVPSYSNAKDLAKEFIKMMATDEGIEIYINCTKTTTAYQYDYTKANGSILFNSYVDILSGNKQHIVAWPNAIPERVVNSFKKFNYRLTAYRDLQIGEITAQKLVDGEIKYAENTIPTWNY